MIGSKYWPLCVAVLKFVMFVLLAFNTAADIYIYKTTGDPHAEITMTIWLAAFTVVVILDRKES